MTDTSTDDLIARLAGTLTPVRRGAVARRLGVSLAVGAVVALVGVTALLGLRPDLVKAVGAPMFWIKSGYCAALAGVGLWALNRLSRPAGGAGRRLAWLALPPFLIAISAIWQLSSATPAAQKALIMGQSAGLCPWYIAVTAAPLFVALIWAARSLAPTRLRLAGAVAGLTAGAAGAMVYALHCPEAGIPFLALWYSLGILIVTAAGSLLGPRLLRW